MWRRFLDILVAINSVQLCAFFFSRMETGELDMGHCISGANKSMTDIQVNDVARNDIGTSGVNPRHLKKKEKK